MRNFPFFLLLSFFLASCEQWDLEQKEFIDIELLNAELLGIDSVHVSLSIKDLGSASISNHGIILGHQIEMPTLLLNDDKISLGQLKAEKDTSLLITGLLPNRIYQFVAFATTSNKTFYSLPLTLRSGNGEVFSHELIYEKGEVLELVGQVIGAESGVLAIAHGFCWSHQNPNPTLNDSFVNLGSRQNSSNFSFKISDWPNDSLGFFRAFATFQSGFDNDTTLYGETLFFDGNMKEAYFTRTNPGWNTREGAVGFTIGSKGYMGGGRKDLGSNYTYYRDFWVYDPALDSWSQIQDMGTAGSSRAFAVGFGIGEYGYVGTGQSNQADSNSDWWRYDPELNSWQPAPGNFPGLSRKEAFAFVIQDKAYVGGGRSESLDLNFKDFFQYDPSLAGAAWKTQASLPVNNGIASAASFSLNDQGYVIGGYYYISSQNTNYLLDNVYRFTPSPGSGSWQQLGDLDGVVTEGLGLSTGTSGFLLGGNGSGFDEYDLLWEYSPLSGWELKRKLPFGGRHSMAGFVINEKLLFGTGSQGDDQFDDFWEYDPK